MIADRYQRRLRGDPTVPFRYEYKMITKSGEERWMDVAPVRIDIKGVPSILGNAIDVTERKQTEEALQKAKEELEKRVRERTAELQRSNEDLEKFAYVSSHDLQEPLRMVGMYVSKLAHLYRDNMDPEARECIKFAVEGAARMSKLVKDVMEYSRINTQGKKPELIDIQLVLDRALKNLKPAIEETQARVTCGPLPTVAVDDAQFVRVFQDLIGNALKFRKEAEPPQVHISAERADRAWLFSVQDNGIGIEQEFFDRIFVAFQRLHANRDRFPGSGIGLAIVKRIIERHGGQVCIDSTPGVGTTIHFTLPMAP
jgi:light-regulated signal transduction histidine kinase (bacteriophytochrome)